MSCTCLGLTIVYLHMAKLHTECVVFRRLEELSNSELDYDSIQEIINCRKMWALFGELILKLKQGELVSLAVVWNGVCDVCHLIEQLGQALCCNQLHSRRVS